jgi:hypothetical protein
MLGIGLKRQGTGYRGQGTANQRPLTACCHLSPITFMGLRHDQRIFLSFLAYNHGQLGRVGS